MGRSLKYGSFLGPCYEAASLIYLAYPTKEPPCRELTV